MFSLWDTFRAAHPLYTIVDQKRTVDFIKTFLAQYQQGGRLPVWELAANETDTMIGYHAVPVIADAAVKGIAGFDLNLAFEAMKHSAERNQAGRQRHHRGAVSRRANTTRPVRPTVQARVAASRAAPVPPPLAFATPPADRRRDRSRRRPPARSGRPQ